MMGAITGAVTAAVTSNACFVAGMVVLTGLGKTAIESIRAGDKVWAWNEKTGSISLKTVQETYVKESNELVHLTIKGEEIIMTPGHPFYSPVKGWVKAIDLRAGDILVLMGGEYVTLELVQHEILESPAKVYNLNVDEDHTYFVSANGVLVHNSYGGETKAAEYGREQHKKWDYGPGVEKETHIGPGARVDGYDLAHTTIYELKPNNPRAIKRGMKQLSRYLNLLGDEWKGVLVLYDK